ncbi:hypothetical protein INR49_029687 [Caranx melampygus]|nr:hypothetical protein INR49_029687 [Caranx melampygus]
MPPKRDAAATSAQPPMKMIKIGAEAQEFGCDPMEDKYRLAEESNYSPFPNNEDDLNFLFLAENLRVPKNLYERIAEIADYKKYTSALLMILFDRETLATHSLQGRRNTFTGEDCHKPQLPPDILRSIIGVRGFSFDV